MDQANSKKNHQERKLMEIVKSTRSWDHGALVESGRLDETG